MNDDDYGDNGDYEYGFEEMPEERYGDSYVQRERATHAPDEGWRDMSNQTFLGDRPVYISPDQMFRNEVTLILQSARFEFDVRDKQVLVKHLDDLHWKHFKLPLLYVAGYYVFKHKMTKRAFTRVTAILKDMEHRPILPYETLKYARYWERILA
jgi:hypothetical protein